jgi:class 3 adenylate cyclase
MARKWCAARADSPTTARRCIAWSAAKKLRDCCPKCGAIVHGRPKHCGNCGAPLLTLWTDRPRIQTPEHLSKQIVPKRGHGGRIIATILRADIVNSTGITGRLEPEDAKRILFPVLKIMADAVHRYEGIVVRDEGDAIVASFGAPLAVEDHAQRACYAALDMQAAIHSHSVKMAPDLGAPLAARIGIDSGLVVYTTQEDAGKEVLDRIDGTPLSIVARIEPFAAPEISCSARVRCRRLKGTCRCAQWEPAT